MCGWCSRNETAALEDVKERSSRAPRSWRAGLICGKRYFLYEATAPFAGAPDTRLAVCLLLTGAQAMAVDKEKGMQGCTGEGHASPRQTILSLWSIPISRV